MALGIVLLAIVAGAEGLILFMIKAIFDRVLTPSAPDSDILLFVVPGLHVPVLLNRFFPSNIHNVWTVVAISLLVDFLTNYLAEYGGNLLIQLTGHRGIRKSLAPTDRIPAAAADGAHHVCRD